MYCFSLLSLTGNTSISCSKVLKVINKDMNLTVYGRCSSTFIANSQQVFTTGYRKSIFNVNKKYLTTSLNVPLPSGPILVHNQQ